jgi:hypothetical protein
VRNQGCTRYGSIIAASSSYKNETAGNRVMTRIMSRLLIVGLLASASVSHASVINYSLTSLGGISYRYDYTVTNDGSITPTIALFDISFDPALYDESSLTNLSTTPGWDIFILGSGIGIPAAFDASTVGPGIGVSESLGGFAVSFNWLGGGTPGIQEFQIYDGSTFDLLGEGVSVLASSSTAVPEPGTFALLGLGLLALAFKRRWITSWTAPSNVL